MTRTPRSMTDRANSSTRPDFGRASRSYLEVPLDSQDETCEYIWAAETVRGQDNNDNIRRMMDTRGFAPVTCEQMPSMAPLRLHGDPDPDPKAPIRRGGLVLMERPKAWAEEERAMLARDSADSVRAVKREHSRNFRNENFREGAGSHVTERQETRGGKFPDA